jgi:hypothetical protein
MNTWRRARREPQQHRSVDAELRMRHTLMLISYSVSMGLLSSDDFVMAAVALEDGASTEDVIRFFERAAEQRAAAVEG